VVILFIYFPSLFFTTSFFVQRKKRKEEKKRRSLKLLFHLLNFLTRWFWVLRCMIFLRHNITHALYIEEKKEYIIDSATMVISAAKIWYLKYSIVLRTPGQVLWDATVRLRQSTKVVTYHST